MDSSSKPLSEVRIIDLAEFLVKECPEDFLKVMSFSESWPSSAIIPLFFCQSYEQLRVDGFNIPREFVVETALRENPEFEANTAQRTPKDKNAYIGKPVVDAAGNPKDFCEIARENIRARVELLRDLNKNRVAWDDIRDWCSGAFRRYLFLDSEVHGTAGTMDLKEVKVCSVEFYKKWFSSQTYDSDANQDCNRRMLRNRFALPKEDRDGLSKTNDPMLKYREFFRRLYPEDFLEIRKFMGLDESQEDVAEAIKNYFVMPAESSENIKEDQGPHLPKERGFALKFRSPTGRIRILVVDDKTEKAVGELRSDIPIGDLFEFETLELNAAKKTSDVFVREAIKAIKDKMATRDEGSAKCTPFYDCILLDLCLGETAGSDLFGYQLIKYFRQLMPMSPVVIFSEHEDMGHITRAFSEGACWFLKKSEAGVKLARHFMSLLTRADWQREWRAIGKLYHVDVDDKDVGFKRRFERKGEWNYLTVKCLESLPGHYIHVEKMSGGISSAVTFRAQKGMKDRDRAAQSPVVIKIDSVFNTRMEYERYFRFIRPYIANEAGRIEQRERMLDREHSSIVYTFAGRNDSSHRLDTLEKLIAVDVLSRETCDFEKYRKTFDVLFVEILPRLHKVTDKSEFRDTKSSDGISSSLFSDFPNHFLGEFDPNEKGDDPWFLSNYSYRMPIEKRIEHFKIEEKAGNPMEVYGVYRDESKSKDDPEAPYSFVIECQHKCASGRYEKVRLAGYLASFYARFRRHIFPGMVLPVRLIEGGTKDRRDTEEGEILSWCINEHQLAFPRVNKFEGINVRADYKCGARPVIALRDSLVEIYKENISHFKSPVGIVHGDLNFRNIMIESRVHASKEKEADVTKTLTDVWLIDFARTRRDIIAHDFNVAFTSMLPLLFQQDLVGKCEKDKNVDLKMIRTREQKDYVDKVNDRIEPFLTHVLFDKTDAVADVIADDKRLVFVYRILRRIRKAALQAGISEEMYLLTTALSCLYAFKIYYNQKMPDAACALVLTALLCERHLCETFKKA